MAGDRSRKRQCRPIVPGDGGFGVFGAGRPGQQPDSMGPDGAERRASPVREPGGGGENRPPRAPARRSGRPGKRIIGVAAVTAAVAAAGTAYAVTQSSNGGSEAGYESGAAVA